MDLPEEIVYKILSYLPNRDLVQINLSNKQYWNIYRTRKLNCPWDSSILWLGKLLGTNEMRLKNELYIHSFISLVDGYPLTFIPKIPVENNLVTFKKYLDGYIWYPAEKVDLSKMQQILNERDKSLTFFKVDSYCTDKILEIFNKFILRHIWQKVPKEILNFCCKKELNYESDCSQESGDQEFEGVSKLHNYEESKDQLIQKNGFTELYRFPDDDEIDVYLVLYLTERSLSLSTTELEFADEVEVDGHIIWKVLKVENEKVDIGRAVLSPKLHHMMGDDIGIALFGRGNKVFGLGNFNYHKAEKNVINSIPRRVFDTYNFVVVKK